MALLDTILGQLKQAPVLATIGSGLAGSLPSGVSNTTVTPQENPAYAGLGDLLRRRATERLMSSFDTRGLEAEGIANVNTAFRGVNEGIGNELTSRGLASSPVGVNAMANADIARRGNIASFLNTLPELRRDIENQDFNTAAAFYNAAPQGQVQKVEQPGGIANGISSAAEMLAFMAGQGLIGGKDNVVVDTISKVLGSKPNSVSIDPGTLADAAASAANMPNSLGAIAGLGGAGAGLIGGLGAGGTAGLGTAGSEFVAGNIGGLIGAPNAGIAAPIAPAAAGGEAGGISGALGLGGGSGLFGLGAATIPVLGGAAVLGGLLWKKSQIHPTADKWVQGEQNPFDQTMARIRNQAEIGAISEPESKMTQQINVSNYLKELFDFAQRGKKERIVAQQALSTFGKYYGEPGSWGIGFNLNDPNSFVDTNAR